MILIYYLRSPTVCKGYLVCICWSFRWPFVSHPSFSTFVQHVKQMYSLEKTVLALSFHDAHYNWFCSLEKNCVMDQAFMMRIIVNWLYSPEKTVSCNPDSFVEFVLQVLQHWWEYMHSHFQCRVSCEIWDEVEKSLLVSIYTWVTSILLMFRP